MTFHFYIYNHLQITKKQFLRDSQYVRNDLVYVAFLKGISLKVRGVIIS